MPDAPILVWGAGAVGGTVGAFLKRAGHDVTFVDIVEEHVASIRDPSRGLRLCGPVAAFTVVAPAFTPQTLAGTWRKVILSVKSHHTEEACRALARHLDDKGYVVCLQNGLTERTVASILGASRTIGAFVNFGADWLGPGEILYGNRGAVVIGEIDGLITGRLESLHRLLLDFDDRAIMTDNIWGYLWGKLAYGAMLFAQALGASSIADSLADPGLFPLWHGLAREVLVVALAEGVTPEGFNGFDPASFLPGATEEAARRSLAALVAFNRASAKTHSGVWRDLAVRKRRTEVEAQIAPILDIGAKHGLACPLLERLVTMIREIERGERTMTDDNLRSLSALAGAAA